MKLGTENRKQTIAAAVLGALFLALVAYEVITFSSSSTSASTEVATPDLPLPESAGNGHQAAHGSSKSKSGKKARPPQSLDPTLHLSQLAATEQIKYEGSGRNIFVAQSDAEIPKPLGSGATDARQKVDKLYTPPVVAAAPPIPLKFFGFANQPGEPKKVFLKKDDDVFIAGEGEIIDRRYKVVRISATSVDIQDVVNSGPPQSIPLTLGNPS